jgi:hypothetical protein
MRLHLAAWNIFQSWHGPAKRRQSSGAFALDQGFESFANQSGFLSDTRELLRDAEEFVIEGEGGSHRHRL